MNHSPPPPQQSSTTTTTTTTTTTACSAAAAAAATRVVGDSLVSSSHTAAAAAALAAASSTSSSTSSTSSTSTSCSLSRRDALLQLALDAALFFWLLPKDVFMIVVRMLLCSTCAVVHCLFRFIYSIALNILTIVCCFHREWR